MIAGSDLQPGVPSHRCRGHLRRGGLWSVLLQGLQVLAIGLGLAGCGARASQAELSVESSPASAYIWRNVVMGGGGFVAGMVFHPGVKNLMYARTDVGGAYRWDDAGQKWIPLTDWLSAAQNNFMGIESIALDPGDPQRVYLAAGTYSGGSAAILRSQDQGRTFQWTEAPFKMGGNETGRFNGERLAVDPNDGDILYFGSRHDGLWKSGDRGATWSKVAAFPEVGPGAAPARSAGASSSTNARPRIRRGFGQSQAVGIVSVVFDGASGKPGEATPKILAAVSTTETNLYCSADAGATWQAVPDQPVGLRPNHLVLSPDGLFYLTYGREPGPNMMSDGAVWKFDPGKVAWTNITPVRPPDADGSFGYGAIAVDAQHPATLMVTTFAHWRPHDLIFRSTDRGAHWVQLWQGDTEWDHSSAPYTKDRTPHWMGTMVINPCNADEVLFTTGYGIWCCVNVTQADAGRPTRWVFRDDGLEETVPLALISPPAGAHLISGVGDIDGFVHDDLNVSPARGTFSGPRFGNTEYLAFAAQNPEVIVRSGTGGNQPVHAAYSGDGGATWQALAGEPPDGNGAGPITIAADAKIIVWTPRGGGAYETTDAGVHWMVCGGLAAGTRVVADTVNPEVFYAMDPRSGEFCRSTNGAAGFTAEGFVAGLPPDRGNGAGFGGVTVTATPGREGDVWLAARRAGLFHSTNGGASFQKLGPVQEAESLGLGRAAPGRNYPALFLAGKIGDLQALFRSDDAGETWVRINDDRHQYGYISQVTGDPRILGRVYFATGGRGVIYGEPKE
jgi:photosystem II stability/assembly factor-like uncharacterized protein